MIAYINCKKPMVLIRHRTLQMWEVFSYTKKKLVNNAIASAISFEKHKSDAITDMRKKGRTDIPASGWNKVSYSNDDLKSCATWHQAAETVIAKAGL